MARRPPELFDELPLLDEEDERVEETLELVLQLEFLPQFEDDEVLAELRVTLKFVSLVESLFLLNDLKVLVSPTGINML